MKRDLFRAIQAGVIVALSAASAPAQDKPLVESFHTGAIETYEAQITIRTEIHSVSMETAGDKTYVKPSSHFAQVAFAWTSSRRILEVSSDGAANLEEVERPASAGCAIESGSDDDSRKLREPLEDLCSRLRSAQPMRYAEEANGTIRNLSPDTALTFGEDGPPLLAWWLRRNLRPSAILPALPFQIGARSQRPIHVHDMTGSETTEWSEYAPNASVATLHVVQQLSWPEPRAETSLGSASGAPFGKTVFFADSSTSVSLLDGTAVSSTRTASRETTRVLDSIAGLPRAPEFSSKLTIVITLRRTL